MTDRMTHFSGEIQPLNNHDGLTSLAGDNQSIYECIKHLEIVFFIFPIKSKLSGNMNT